ncbi:hypothetical protein L6452_34652 [Arctium lappa]|uniref:Uncharacterized protein n=1 Tax=Arctium lappa TaxID=4217 RepID=A0ACB8YK09_ARCLA|nr:hypothetical protein L6452_34652 [Arctium lappa]
MLLLSTWHFMSFISRFVCVLLSHVNSGCRDFVIPLVENFVFVTLMLYFGVGLVNTFLGFRTRVDFIPKTEEVVLIK